MVLKWKWGLASVKGTCVEHALQDFRVIFVKLFGVLISLPLCLWSLLLLLIWWPIAMQRQEVCGALRTSMLGAPVWEKSVWGLELERKGSSSRQQKEALHLLSAADTILCFSQTLDWKSLPFFRLSSEPTSLSHVVSRKQFLGTIDWRNILWKNNKMDNP